MKNIAKLSLYGIVFGIYTCAFLFGAIYPQYGIPRESIVYEEESSHEISYDSWEQDILELQNRKIIYQSYFLEKFKKLF